MNAPSSTPHSALRIPHSEPNPHLDDSVEYTVMTRDVVKVYRMGDTEVRALDGVDVTIRTGEYI